MSKARSIVTAASLLSAALTVVLMPARAHAQFTLKGSATGQFESNSNIFALPSGTFTQPGFNNLRRGDTFYAYGAEADATYLWGQQQLYATAHATHYEFQHLTDLSHNEYKVDTGIIWKLGDSLDGSLSVARSHAIVPFINLLGTEGAVTLLTLADELRETLVVNYKLDPDWRTTGTFYYDLGYQSTSDHLVTELKQTSGTATLNYLGLGPLTWGATVGYLSGAYEGYNAFAFGASNPSYSQTTAGFVADYRHNRTVFEGQFGYSLRTSNTQNDRTSAFTGLFDLKHQLTPKTSITAKIDRAINSNYLNTGSEIDTDAGVSINWQTTYKVATILGYTFTFRKFPHQGNNPVGSDRFDIQENWTLAISYQPLRWLQIKPYGNLLTRRSTIVGGGFDSTVYGVTVTASR